MASLSFLSAKMRVMCYERYPRFHTFWGPERQSDQLSISQHRVPGHAGQSAPQAAREEEEELGK